eukprot:CAMPEP_0195333646 /NCGR_PEP_ID=MMETSP0708-20121125/14232_1 /TAXON_ID=33640 /ORGANISM="Asterionellopsis glacialis, Strain CCMP134" /LENGTH=85 /DNA_ID=CAMNT_0040403105 /DNA_START=62 /DNA_END=315 /DNA_ORIENTATION=+
MTFVVGVDFEDSLSELGGTGGGSGPIDGPIIRGATESSFFDLLLGPSDGPMDDFPLHTVALLTGGPAGPIDGPILLTLVELFESS